jgi:hypothetical protein
MCPVFSITLAFTLAATSRLDAELTLFPPREFLDGVWRRATRMAKNPKELGSYPKWRNRLSHGVFTFLRDLATAPKISKCRRPIEFTSVFVPNPEIPIETHQEQPNAGPAFALFQSWVPINR